MSRIILEGINPVIPLRKKEEKPLSHHFPSMEKLSNGEIVLCCKELEHGMNDPSGKILLFRSGNGGKTWEEGISPTCHDEISYPGKGYLMAHITELKPDELISVYAIIDTDKNNPLFNPETDGMQPATIRSCKSFDNGNSWEPPRDIAFTSKDIIVPGKIIKLPDGTCGFPCEMHDHWVGGYKEGSCSRFIKSYDNGETFSEGNIIAADEGILFGDARPVFTGKEVLIFFWTLDLVKMKDLPIHYVSSIDSGVSWTKPAPISITTQIMSPFALSESLMVAVHQDRFSDNPGLKALLSYDGGMNWNKSTEITIFGAGSKPDGTNPFAQFDQFQFGYSSLLKTGDNSLLVSFWHAAGSGTSISVAEIRIKE